MGAEDTQGWTATSRESRSQGVSGVEGHGGSLGHICRSLLVRSQSDSLSPKEEEGAELDDHSSCHQTASRRDNSPHCTDGEAGEAIHRAASSLARLFCLGKETNLNEVEAIGTIWDH